MKIINSKPEYTHLSMCVKLSHLMQESLYHYSLIIWILEDLAHEGFLKGLYFTFGFWIIVWMMKDEKTPKRKGKVDYKQF